MTDAKMEAVDFLYKHHDLTRSASLAVIEKLTGNGFLITTAAALAAKDAEIAELRGVWMAGEPPTPWRDEWFIAKTIHGDKVVLRALPEEWTYDYTTADHTYMIAANIVCWMQFPDSDYIAPTAEEAPIFAAKDAEIARLTAAIREVAGASGCCDACPCHMRATRKARAALTGEDRG